MTDNLQHVKTGESLIGRTVADRYEVVDYIGHGAMGAVYKAKHKTIGRLFAVKTLHGNHVSDERSLQRFRQEAQAMSVLTHPNLIQISDYGQLDGEVGAPFFVMEYLEGISLHQWTRKNGPMPQEQAVPIFAQIADALAHAHAKGLIHRDLKPSNIMLIGDANDFVKVVDLGIAKVLQENEDPDLRLTQAGEVFGSPLYMSPEQCMGSALDTRSDIYSLGCLMYEVLTARPALKGANFVQTAYMHMNEMPTPLREVIPTIDPELEDTVTACLAKKPEERISSMIEVRDRMRALEGKLNCALVGTAVPRRPFHDELSTTQRSTIPPNATPVGKGAAIDKPHSNVGPIIGIALTMGLVLVFWLSGLPSVDVNKLTHDEHGENHASTADGAGAPSLQNRAVQPPPNTTVDVSSPVYGFVDKTAPEEVDVVAVYAANEKNDNEHPADVDVNVAKKLEPITLVLFSYMPVHWKVHPYTGAVIKKVVASGYFGQEVSQHPKDPNAACEDVTKMCHKSHGEEAFNTSNLFHTDAVQIQQNRQAAEDRIRAQVQKMLGTKIRRFQGGFYGNKFDI